MSSSVFSVTLQEITATKLSELSRRRTIFEDNKASLISTTQLQTDQKQRLATLVEGLKQCFSMKTVKRKRGNLSGPSRIVSGSPDDPGLEVLLKNFEQFLEQARYDPSVSPKMLQDWEMSLMKRLNVQSLKYQYAALYGQLVTEWLSAERLQIPTTLQNEAMEGIDEKPKNQERDASRSQWEKLIFEPFETDKTLITEYLRTLFEKAGIDGKALLNLRRKVKTFEVEITTPGQFNETTLCWVINGLLGSGLLSEEKNAVLKDFLASSVILTEVADVLNMRMASLETWSWETVVPVEQRRHVTGSFHMYIDEDLLQAIFLQYIGVKWAVFFKAAFTTFSNHEGAWKSVRQDIPRADKKRREHFLGQQQKKPSVQSKRQSLYKSIFFMSQLPDSIYQTGSTIEGEEEVTIRGPQGITQQGAQGQMAQQHFQQRLQQAQQQQSMQAMQSMQSMQSMMPVQQAPPTYSGPHLNSYHSQPNDEYDEEGSDEIRKSPMATKQFLLHLVSTEIIINTRLYGDFTCTRSEFDSFFPSLPHSTIHAVLSFFGLSRRWQQFFKNFLEAPLKFTSDGPSVSTRTRRRGVPGAHALSSVCGEVILFCLDYSVNQKASGTPLFRMHDDFWVWSPSHAKVVQAWKAIIHFRDIMGVSLNEGKTGTVRVMRDGADLPPTDLSLPIGDVRWGFLKLDPKSGRFLIDQDMVDKHTEDLKSQLDKKKGSVFSWIQAWNTYAGTFFKTNFGKPANCFGREHIDSMLSTMTRIQNRIFSDSNVVDFLKSTLETRLGIKDIPDGYLYFPTGLGGLELQNPFIGILQIRDAVDEQPTAAMDSFFQEEALGYERLKRNFNKTQRWPGNSLDPDFPEGINTFFSFEEYTRYREEFHVGKDGLLSVYQDLLRQPVPQFLNATQEDTAMLTRYHGSLNMSDGYMRWVAQLYGPDMIDRFGGLKIVDSGLLPIGMVNLFRSGRVHWKD